MSEAPERIWANTTRVSCGSWDDYRMVESRLWSPYYSGVGVEYIRADRIEELESKLEKALTALGDVQRFVKELEPYADQGHTLVPALQKACAVYTELKGETNE